MNNNNKRIVDYLDNLLEGYEQTPSLLEQKEELEIHLTERMQDYMAKGLTYDEAFNASVRDLGDISALVSAMQPVMSDNDCHGKRSIYDYALVLSSLSPFVYIALGMLFGGFFWAWGWVIIPLSGLLFIRQWNVILVGATPFIYVLLGLFFGWWAWGWLIIPVSGIVFIAGRPFH